MAFSRRLLHARGAPILHVAPNARVAPRLRPLPRPRRSLHGDADGLCSSRGRRNRESAVSDPVSPGFPDGGTAERTGASADHGTFNGCAVCRTDQGACICSHGASDERALAGPGIMLRVAAGGQRQRCQEGDYGNIQLHGHHTPLQKETWPPIARPALRLRDILRAAPDILRAAVEPRYPAFVCAGRARRMPLRSRQGKGAVLLVPNGRTATSPLSALVRFTTDVVLHLRPPNVGFSGAGELL